MAQVAYYRYRELKGAEALEHLKLIIKEAAITFTNSAVEVSRLQEWYDDVAKRGHSVPIFDRIKVEVKDISEANKLTSDPNFVRFAIGGRTSLEELVVERKKLGRTDWYV